MRLAFTFLLLPASSASIIIIIIIIVVVIITIWVSRKTNTEQHTSRRRLGRGSFLNHEDLEMCLEEGEEFGQVAMSWGEMAVREEERMTFQVGGAKGAVKGGCPCVFRESQVIYITVVRIEIQKGCNETEEGGQARPKCQARGWGVPCMVCN